MSKQYLALVEETTRGTDPGSGYVFLPTRNTLRPAFNPNDELRQEHRGQKRGLGSVTSRRLSSAWTYSPEVNLYPGSEIGLLLKHLLGKAGIRSVLETTAYKGIVYPVTEPYGSGAELADKAIGVVPNTDEEGTTKSQYFGGGRIRSATLAVQPDDDVMLTFEMGGAGPWVGSPDQTAIGSPTDPSLEPFLFSDVAFYIGSGISRTGTGPDYTAIAPNTMTQFYPDNFNLTINNGLNDKIVMNRVAGPSQSRRKGEITVEGDFAIDYRDPSSGFSSADEFKAIYSDQRQTSLLVVMTHPDLAGDTSEKYSVVIDIPLVLLNADTPDDNVEGETPVVNFSFRALYSETTEYRVAFLTVDQASAY